MHRLLRHFAASTKEASVALSWFLESFDVTDFTGIDVLLYEFLRYSDIINVVPSEKYLEYFLKTEAKRIIKQRNVKVDSIILLNYDEPVSLEEATRVLNPLVINQWNQSIDNAPDDAEITVDVFNFLSDVSKVEAMKVLTTQFPKFQDGSFSLDELLDKLLILKAKAGLEKLEKLTTMLITEAGRNNDSKQGDESTMRILFKTGIPAIDDDIGGVYSKQVFGVAGQPGSGKTRLAMIAFVWNCAMTGRGVLVDELEMTKKEIENILIAYHIIQIYGGQVKIPDSLINKGGLTEQQKKYYEAAKMDLFESGKYGRIIIRESELDTNNLKAKMIKFFKNNPDIEFWAIDYAGLAKHTPGPREYPKKQYEIITDVYEISKYLARDMDVGVLILNQYNDDGIARALAGNSIRPGDIQGGHIAHRHSDFFIDMTYTDEQKAADLRMLSSSKGRSAAGFSNVPLLVDLSVSIFKQVNL